MPDLLSDQEVEELQEHDLSRIGVSLPSNLLNSFDQILKTRGYSSRSEGIRDAIRSYIRYYKWMADINGPRQGVITIVYDHHQRGLIASITDIQHDYMGLIQASLHSHVSHSRCVEVLLVRGEAKEVKEVAERLMAQKGVETVKLTTIPLEG
ncbi:nickel-responsive transcriptional regulator NikR [Methanospirillum lacunae]|jgi:CopG family transcriptional regulator, nickel-responsive regulator|uniref:Putative nickel-responsive regulator n=1 Tax=Methanospirillum lacunae TaxID=668570 RepID=A0A2V2N0W0_9EURY|nr:nickel-responsive transcriptional regulator NikR [Methanospirillum lacunae]PWR73802.1 nickel-responsive transcriptional regulator NikR [Methanospirillum lacunae]